jgi:hypothetical protein
MAVINLQPEPTVGSQIGSALGAGLQGFAAGKQRAKQNKLQQDQFDLLRKNTEDQIKTREQERKIQLERNTLNIIKIMADNANGQRPGMDFFNDAVKSVSFFKRREDAALYFENAQKLKAQEADNKVLMAQRLAEATAKGRASGTPKTKEETTEGISPLNLSRLLTARAKAAERKDEVGQDISFAEGVANVFLPESLEFRGPRSKASSKEEAAIGKLIAKGLAKPNAGEVRGPLRPKALTAEEVKALNLDIPKINRERLNVGTPQRISGLTQTPKKTTKSLISFKDPRTNKWRKANVTPEQLKRLQAEGIEVRNN